MPVRLISAALVGACAAWLTQGTLAVTAADGVRLAVLPLSPIALVVAIGAGAVAALLTWLSGTLAPAWLLALVVAPWIPLPLPSAVLVWSGPLAIGVWICTLTIWTAACGVRPAALMQRVRRPVVLAGVLAAVVYGFAAFHVGPAIPAGDEPHYLVITQSLLRDRDLRIENNHRRGDYRTYFDGDLRPDFLRRGRDGEIYSIHAPGLPVLVAPAFAIAGYHGVLLFLIVLSSLTAALLWHLARRVTGDTDAAWFAWAAVVFAPTVLLNAFTVYPDGVGALLVLTGVWALVRARDERETGTDDVRAWLLHGAAIALLPWLHTRFALLAGGLGALVLVELARTKNPAAKASAFLAVPAVSGLAWIGFFIAIYGAPDPAIPYRGSDLGSPAYVPGGLGGIFFDQQYGLFVCAPVLAAAIAGLVALWRRGGEFRWLPLELLFVVAPYLLTVTHFAMWWGGWSTPARFLLPVIPSLGVAVAAAWSAATRRGTRAFLCLLLGVTMGTAAITVLVGGGRLGYFSRDNVYSLTLEWLSSSTDLQHGAPAFFAAVRRGQPGGLFFGEIAVWVLAGTLAWLSTRAAGRSRLAPGRASLAVAAVLLTAAAAMGALTIVWHLERVPGVTPAASQVALLGAVASGPSYAAIDLSGRHAIGPASLLSRVDIRVHPGATLPGTGRDERPIFAVPALPAGDYLLTTERRVPGGWLLVGVGRDQFAVLSQPAEAFVTGVEVRFPVAVRGIFVRGDEDARRNVTGLRVRVLRVSAGPAPAAQGTARHGVRYGSSIAYFMDGHAYPEPSGFWIEGAHRSRVVFEPDAEGAALTLLLRNPPVPNRIRLESGEWRQDLALDAGEERRIEVPLDSNRSASAVTFEVEAGFRPSESDAASTDGRFLGVWISLEPPVGQNLTTPPK